MYVLSQFFSDNFGLLSRNDNIWHLNDLTKTLFRKKRFVLRRERTRHPASIANWCTASCINSRVSKTTLKILKESPLGCFLSKMCRLSFAGSNTTRGERREGFRRKRRVLGGCHDRDSWRHKPFRAHASHMERLIASHWDRDL